MDFANGYKKNERQFLKTIQKASIADWE